MSDIPKRITDKFWAYVTTGGTDQCWPWLGHRGTKGYGAVQWHENGKSGYARAHRVAWALHNKRPIPEGMHVLHSCDNPACVNPFHLRIGTNTDNVADRTARNRHARIRGEESTSSKLTEEAVRNLLNLRVSGISFSELAEAFLLDKKTVQDICRGKAWPHMIGSPGAPTYEQLAAASTPTRNGGTLTTEDAIAIMKRLADGDSGKQIAQAFGIHFASVSDIKHGKTWAHLAGVDGNPTIEQMQTAKPKSKMVAKLDAEKARQIKLRLKAGEGLSSIARAFGVSPGAVSHIKQGRTWGEIQV